MSTFSALTFKAIVSLGMLLLYAHSRKSQYLCYKNIAQKSAADFMQIDETDILIYIVYNSWATVNAAMRPYKPRIAVFVFRRDFICPIFLFRYTYFIQFQYSLF